MKKVVRVDSEEFELDDGTIYPHMVKLEEVPTVEEFQKIYEYCYKLLGLMDLELQKSKLEQEVSYGKKL
jgi:hypothetical protein